MYKIIVTSGKILVGNCIGCVIKNLDFNSCTIKNLDFNSCTIRIASCTSLQASNPEGIMFTVLPDFPGNEKPSIARGNAIRGSRTIIIIRPFSTHRCKRNHLLPTVPVRVRITAQHRL